MGGSPNHGAHYNGDLLSPSDAQLMNDVTGILSRLESGDPTAADQLLPLVYDELRKLAAARLARENPGQTLQATALVHDAYLRLVDVQTAQHWKSRGHFFGAAAEAMLGFSWKRPGRNWVPDVGAAECAFSSRRLWTSWTFAPTKSSASIKPWTGWPPNRP